MAISKNHRFGLISFFILLILAILITMEPWKDLLRGGRTSISEAAPAISIHWDSPALAFPDSPFSDSVLRYTGFDLAYNEAHEQAAWVAYVLTRKEAESQLVSRTDNFRPDTSIRSGSAALLDYRGSGFDRGHLAPAGDMKWSTTAMSESFLMSNMSPQNPSFNRGIWRKLEAQVRDWAIEKDSIYVITGPVLNRVNNSIGQNEVSVPEYYFKVLVDLSPPDHSIIAFLLPNEKSSEDIWRYSLTVDSLESFTGLDFFASAPDKPMIEWLEGRIETGSWN